MGKNSYFYANKNDGAKRDLMGAGAPRPTISTALDSVRAYQWEVAFTLSPGKAGKQVKPLTLAAKQVNGIGASVEDIEVNRVNDKVYYPGRPSMEEAVITFDNLHTTKVDKLLYEMFAATYDPRTGALSGGQVPGGPFSPSTMGEKREVIITQLNNDGTPRNQIKLYGAYPKTITHGEYNYSTNEFHTIEMTFRYDFFTTSLEAQKNNAKVTRDIG